MRYLAVLALTLVLSLPAAALAQQPNEDGVFVDPESPTSKEYAVPTEEARRDSSGVPSSGSGGEPPLFGVGVEEGSGDGARDSAGGAVDGATASRDAMSRRADAIAAADGDAADGDAAGGLLGIAIGLGVVLLGAGMAYVLKRRHGWSFPPLRRAN